jgi:hypothetical protein
MDKNCVFCGTHDGVTRECRCPVPDRVEINGHDLQNLDEIVLGNGWLHLERMSGKKSRSWCLIVTNEKGETLNITINEIDGYVTNAFIFENEWEKPFPSEWGVK